MKNNRISSRFFNFTVHYTRLRDSQECKMTIVAKSEDIAERRVHAFTSGGIIVRSTERVAEKVG